MVEVTDSEKEIILAGSEKVELSSSLYIVHQILFCAIGTGVVGAYIYFLYFFIFDEQNLLGAGFTGVFGLIAILIISFTVFTTHSGYLIGNTLYARGILGKKEINVVSITKIHTVRRRALSYLEVAYHQHGQEHEIRIMKPSFMRGGTNVHDLLLFAVTCYKLAQQSQNN